MVYILLADGFEEIEALAPADLLRRADIGVQTVSIGDINVTGSHDITVKADIQIDEVVAGAMKMLVLPGGPGHTKLDESPKVHALIDYAAAHGIYIAAICAAPSIIGKKGLLKGKRAVCFPGYEKYLEGADVGDEKAVSDGKYITGRGAGAAVEFGLELVRNLKGRAAADAVAEKIRY